MNVKPGRAIFALTVALGVTPVSFVRAQEPGTAAGPLSSEPRFFAPFSANAATTVVQRTPGGGRITRKATATYYRDSSGRVRVEYTPVSDTRSDDRSDIYGGGRKVAIVMPNPYARGDRVFLVDEEAKLVEKMDAAIYEQLFSTTKKISIATGMRRFTDFFTAQFRFAGDGIFDDLGSQTMGGVAVTGTRFTTTLTKAVDERWESPELGLVLRAHIVDPEFGWDVEYALSDIRRTEPPQDLFVLPAGYQYRTNPGMMLQSPGADLNRLFPK